MEMNVEIDRLSKIFKVKLNGFPSVDGVQRVYENYESILEGIIPKNYSLLIDCYDIGVFQQQAVSVLERLFKLYIDLGFKNIVLVKSKESIQNMQLTRVARSVPGFYGVFVDDISEALKTCVQLNV